jgi:hypothetical protein
MSKSFRSGEYKPLDYTTIPEKYVTLKEVDTSSVKAFTSSTPLEATLHEEPWEL